MDLFTVGLAASKIKIFTSRDFLKILGTVILGFIVMIVFIIVILLGCINIFFSTPEIEGIYVSNIEFTKGLGILSEKYESNGNPAVIANNKGDRGGKSYGAWQIASKVLTMDEFLRQLKKYDETLFNRLISAKIKDKGYGVNFDKEWIKISKENPEYFYQVQWSFIKRSHYDPIIEHFKKKGIDFTKRSWTLRNVIWSMAVQHRYGSITILNELDLKLSDNLEDDKKLIIGIYDERKKVNKYFKGSPSDIKNSVYKRFIREKKDALEMLRQELESLKGANNG